MNDEHSTEQIYFAQGSQVGSQAPDAAKREHEKFKKRFSHALKNSYGLASNKKELERCIQKAGEQAAGSVELGVHALAEFSEAATQLKDFKDKRTHGIRGVNASFQNGIVAFSRFAAAYSNILEAVSKASGPYTEIGYQTVTIFLITFVNKKTNDDSIEGHLSRIERILPRLKTWKEIYGDEEMTKWLSEIYDQVIEFSRCAVEYFCRRWKRVWLAVNPLGMNNKFDDIAQSIYETLAEINAHASQKLHLRSQRMEQRLQDSQAQLAEVKAQLAVVLSEQAASRDETQRKDKQVDEDGFRIFERSLSHGDRTPQRDEKPISSHQGFDLSLARTTLKRAFPNAQEFSTSVPWSMHTLMTPSRILSHPSFQQWANTQSSALLFIYGETKREGRATTVAMPCWLSPAAIHIVEHISSFQEFSTMRDRIVCFSCRPDQKTHIDTAASVLAMVAIKLLSTRKDILRERLIDFRDIVDLKRPVHSRTSSPSLLRSPEKFPVGEDDDNTDRAQQAAPISLLELEQSRMLLNEVLGELSKRDDQSVGENNRKRMTAFIVLDRVDCIKELDNEIMNMKKFLRELAPLTRETNPFSVKLVVLAEARLQKKWNENLHETLVDPNKVFEVRMDQRELSSREMAVEKQQRLWKDE